MTTLAQGVSRKINRVIGLDIDSESFRSALATLPSVEAQSGNSKAVLRSYMESGLLQSNVAFSQRWGEFVSDLQRGEAALSSMQSICKQVKGIVSDRQTTPSALISRTETLLNELSVAERKDDIVKRFQQDYQLDASVAETITSGEVDETFFEALQRVHTVHENCRSLLHTHHQRAGLELLDSMSSYEESAYERLCKWVQGMCQGLGELDESEVHPLLSRALNALRARPVLLRYCAEEVASARHSSVFKAFLLALTHGGPQGRPRPMEVHAHNPRRYVGDMLAWVHQAVASENELLGALIASDSGSNDAPAPADTAASGLGVISTPELLDKVLAGLCSPLRLRVEQVLHGSNAILVTFQIYQLLEFYRSTIQQLMHAEAQLLTTLVQLRDTAAGGVRSHMRAQTDRLKRGTVQLPGDLSCPPAVTEIVSQLVQVAGVYESDLQDPEATPNDMFKELLTSTVDPLVEFCRTACEGLRADASLDEGGKPNRADVCLLNCLLEIWGTLSKQKSCAAHAATLKVSVDAQVKHLASSEAQRLLSECSGLPLDTVQALTHAAALVSQQTTAAKPLLPPEQQKKLLQDLFRSLSAADALPEYESISMPRMRVAVSQALCECLQVAYRSVYLSLPDAAGSRDVKTPAQVATLLGVPEDGSSL